MSSNHLPGLTTPLAVWSGRSKGLAPRSPGSQLSKEVIEPIARALGGVTEALAKVESAAAAAGLSIEKFDQLRQSLEKGGVSAGGIVDGIQKITEAAERGKIAQVATDLAQLQEISKRGYGPMGTPELNRLIQAAQEFGPVGDAARKALGTLGIQVTSTVKSLDELAAAYGTPKEALAAFIAQLEAIKDPAQRNIAAMQQMGAAGLEIARGINTGAISSKQFAEKTANDANTVSQAWANMAAQIEQSHNRSAAAFERFKETADVSALGPVFTELGNRASIAFTRMGTELQTLISSIGKLAGSIDGSIWDEFSANASQAVDKSIEQISQLISKIGELTASLAGNIWDSFKNAGVEAWDAIVDAVNKAIDAVKKFLGLKSGTGAAPGAAGAAPGSGGAAEMAGGGRVSGSGTETSDSIPAMLSHNEFVQPAAAVRHYGTSFMEAVRTRRLPRFAAGGLAFAAGGSASGKEAEQVSANNAQAANDMANGMAKLASAVEDLNSTLSHLIDSIDGMTSALNDAISALNDAISALNDALKKIAETASANDNSSSSSSGMAGGGVVGGRGTGTSDSNLAWVSRGEHIMPARAVSQPGVLGLLEGLRASGGSLRGIGRFATGGVVSMPALAAGGGGIGHLGTVDLRTDHGSVTVMASQSAVNQLGRLAVTKRMTSTGRKPGFVNG